MSDGVSWLRRLKDRLLTKASPRVSDPLLAMEDVVDDSDRVLQEVRRVLDLPWRSLATSMNIGGFRLIRRIDEGAFSEVWEATDTRTDGPRIALKVYSPERFPADRRLIAALRFWRGAGAMQHLRGREGIVTILEGPSIADAGGFAYVWFTMPLVPGGDLGRALEAGQLSEEERLAIFESTCRAIRSAHAHRVVHRDVRPPNVLLTGVPESPAMLIDFDLAYYDGAFAKRHSTVGFEGASRYLPPDLLKAAPEQQKVLFRRASNDLYGLCVLLFEMFAGLGAPLPHHASERTLARSLPRRTDGRVASGTSSRTRHLVARICAVGLQNDQRHRYQHAADLLAAFERLRSVPALAGPAAVVAAVLLVLAIALSWDEPLAGSWPWIIPVLSLVFVVGSWEGWKKIVSASPRAADAFVRIRITARVCIAAVALASLGLAVQVFRTRLPERLRTVRVEASIDCRTAAGERLTTSKILPLDSAVICSSDVEPEAMHRSLVNVWLERPKIHVKKVVPPPHPAPAPSPAPAPVAVPPPCPAQCCNGHSSCDAPGATCEQKWACELCVSQAQGRDRTWRLWLRGVTLPPGAGWREVEACVVSGNVTAYRNNCAHDRGPPDGSERMFDLPPAHKTLGHYVKVIGKDRSGKLMRIAEKRITLRPLPKSICDGFAFGGFQRVNGDVESVSLGVEPGDEESK